MKLCPKSRFRFVFKTRFDGYNLKGLSFMSVIAILYSGLSHDCIIQIPIVLSFCLSAVIIAHNECHIN